MPTMHVFQPDPKALRALREEITKKLINKGLSPDCGKWSEVFRRHLNKHYYKLPSRHR